MPQFTQVITPETCLARYQWLDECKYAYVKQRKDRMNYLQTRTSVEGMQRIQFQVGAKTVHVAHFVKNLGMYFDTSLTIERQVNAISRACYHHIHNIGHISQYIMTNASQNNGTCLDNVLTALRQCTAMFEHHTKITVEDPGLCVLPREIYCCLSPNKIPEVWIHGTC